MPPSKKKRRPATRSQSKSLVETEAVESRLALNFFLFIIFFSGETRAFNIVIVENYLKVAQDILWSQKLCFDERRLFFFFS